MSMTMEGTLNGVPVIYLSHLDYTDTNPDAYYVNANIMFCIKAEDGEPVYQANWWDEDDYKLNDEKNLPIPSDISIVGKLNVWIDESGIKTVQKVLDTKAIRKVWRPRRIREEDIETATDDDLIKHILDECRLELDMWYGMIVTGCHPFSFDPKFREQDRKHVDDWTHCYVQRRLTAGVIEHEISRGHFTRNELEAMVRCGEILSCFGEDNNWTNGAFEDERKRVHDRLSVYAEGFANYDKEDN